VQTAGGNGLISNIDGQEPLGGPSHRWSSVWTISGAIQTSDETQKTDVKPSDLGLNFIRLLEPIRFKWTEGGKKIITPAVTAKAAVTDETGAIITPAVAAVPAVTESVPGKRRHYGFAAQQVHDAWVKAGAEDFGGWVKTDTTDPNSTEALRPDQITATAVQAIKELDAQVQTDRADMLALQNIVAAQAAEIAAMIAAFAK
jgi:hypothetical protein